MRRTKNKSHIRLERGVVGRVYDNELKKTSLGKNGYFYINLSSCIHDKNIFKGRCVLLA